MRKTITVTLMDEDTPLTFEIKQMAATQKERWILRAMFLISGSAGAAGVNMDTGNVQGELRKHGLALFNGVDIDKVQPLLDDLLACCSYVTGNARQVCTPETVDGYISDVKTLFGLRTEAFKLNFPDFFPMIPAMVAKSESPSSSEAKPEVTLKIPHA